MTPASVLPSLFMRGLAVAGLRELCAIERNSGDGWAALHASERCNIQHIDYRPQPADVADASTETGETVAIHLKKNLAVRIGDRVSFVVDPLRKWVIGGGNQAENLATFNIFRALRPTAATPWTKITVYRFNPATGDHVAQAVQIAQITLSTRVPVSVGDSTYKGGVMFGPESQPPLNVQIGDTFRYNGMTGYITWVTPDPNERREATFYIDLPTPWKQ